MMRGLTLHRPWDWAIAHAGKDIENRPWKPWDSVIDKRIAIHAGKTFDEPGAHWMLGMLPDEYDPPIPDESSVSVIVATTRVVGWVLLAHDPSVGTVVQATSEMSPHAIAETLRSPWLLGPYGWVLRNTIALPKPVPCKGAQGLWQLPAHVESEVLRQEQLGRSEPT